MPAELGNHVVIHGLLADPAKGEDDLCAFRVFRGNEARRNVAEDDFGFAAADAATRAGGKMPAPHRHLVAETEGICGMGTRGKDVTTRLALHKILHGIVAGAKRAQCRVCPWNVVETAASTADGATLAVAGKRFVHGGTGSQIEEILRRPDVTLLPRPYAVEDGGVDGVGVFVHGGQFTSEKIQ